MAVIGRQFPASLAKQVVAQPEPELYRVLSSLQAKEFLYEQPAFPESEYLFKHALTQDVAYGTVLHEQRKVLHERTGQAMEVLYQEKLDDHYSELAYHYRLSGNTEKAVEYLSLAGQLAVQRSAYEDAIGNLTAALNFLKTLPLTPGRVGQQLALHLALGTPLTVTKGWTAPEAETLFQQTQALSQQVGETARRFPMLWQMWALHFLRAEYGETREQGEQLLKLARSQNDAALVVVAIYALGASLFCLGEGDRAHELLKQGLLLKTLEQHRSVASLYFVDPVAACRSYYAWSLWLRGYPEQALRQTWEALTLMRNLGHPFSVTSTALMSAILHQLRREGRACQDQGQSVIATAREQGFTQLARLGLPLLGWGQAAQGQSEVGIAQIRQGLADAERSGDKWIRSYFLAFLAECYGRAGRPTEGLLVVKEAENFVRINRECFYEAEIYRLKGELTLGTEGWRLETSPFSSQAPSLTPQDPSGVAEEAEVCFRKALAIARLWQQQGKTQEAHDLLAPVYNWFTEGFETKDLQDAKALLEELARGG